MVPFNCLGAGDHIAGQVMELRGSRLFGVVTVADKLENSSNSRDRSFAVLIVLHVVHGLESSRQFDVALKYVNYVNWIAPAGGDDMQFRGKASIYMYNKKN